MNLTHLETLPQREFLKVAKNLFPTSKHPVKALKRVIEGKQKLNTDQVQKLSLQLGVTIEELFNGWSHRYVEDHHRFTRKGFTVTLNTDSWVTTIIESGTVISKKILHNGEIALSKYFKLIDAEIASK